MDLKMRRLFTAGNNAVFWWLAIALIAIFRLYLVSYDTIIPIDADSQNYARHAGFYAPNSVFTRLPEQNPGLPIAASVAAQIGVPYKLFLDVIFILMALAAGKVTATALRCKTCGLMTFALLSLNPWFFFNAQLFMTEPLTALIMASLIIAASHFLLLPIYRWSAAVAIGAGLISAAYVLTRPEFPLLICFWLMVLSATIWCNRKLQFRNTHKKPRWRLWLLAVPCLTAVAMIQVVEFVHYRQYGVAALSCTSADGIQALLSALYTIPPDETIRFSPVTRQSLQAACDVSPTMASYRENLLDLESPSYAAAKNQLGLENQVGTWLNWQLVWGFGGVNRKTNLEMRKAANEIRQAQDAGRIGRRTAFYPADPLWRSWLPELPAATIARVIHSIHPDWEDPASADHITQRRPPDPVTIGWFDNNLLRRYGTKDQEFVRVFAVAQDSGYRRARLLTSSGKALADTRIVHSNKAAKLSFEIEKRKLPQDYGHLVLQLIRNVDPKIKPTRFELSPEMYLWNYQTEPAENPAELWKISASATPLVSKNKQYLQQLIGNWYQSVVWFSLVFVFGWGLMRGSRANRLSKLTYLALVGLGFLLLRSSFYALVEVWLNWGEFRYVEPNQVFVVLVLIWSAYVCGAWTHKLVFSRPAGASNAID